MNREEILQALKDLPVIELAGLVKDLEEEFGVSAAAAAPVAVAAAPAAGDWRKLQSKKSSQLH